MSLTLLIEMQRIMDMTLSLATSERGLMLIGVLLLESVFALLWLFIVRRSASA
ncbi:MAG: hypothetical protein AAGF95_32185 [Chloroflexota bacterium]